MKKNRIYLEHCASADTEHAENQRQYAHTFHRRGSLASNSGGAVICVAEAFYELPAEHANAILLHEVGHLIVGEDKGEKAANNAIRMLFGVEISYSDCETHGDNLEYLKPEDQHDAERALNSLGILKKSKSRGRVDYYLRRRTA